MENDNFESVRRADAEAAIAQGLSSARSHGPIPNRRIQMSLTRPALRVTQRARPSGDQERFVTVPGSVVICVGFSPVADMSQMWWSDVKAIRAPSGDQAGRRSRPGPPASATRSRPYADMTQMS